jgi:hypothetical protein
MAILDAEQQLSMQRTDIVDRVRHLGGNGLLRGLTLLPGRREPFHPGSEQCHVHHVALEQRHRGIGKAVVLLLGERVGRGCEQAFGDRIEDDHEATLIELAGAGERRYEVRAVRDSMSPAAAGHEPTKVPLPDEPAESLVTPAQHVGWVHSVDLVIPGQDCCQDQYREAAPEDGVGGVLPDADRQPLAHPVADAGKQVVVHAPMDPGRKHAPGQLVPDVRIRVTEQLDELNSEIVQRPVLRYCEISFDDLFPVCCVRCRARHCLVSSRRNPRRVLRE